MGNGKKVSVEVHKFGGASLADGAAFRRVVEILAGRRGPRVAVVSAPAGVTDLLLGLATRATAGEGQLDREVQALATRYLEILRAATGRGNAEAAAEIRRSMDELGRLLSSLAVLRELTPRTRDFIVSRGERLSARILAAALDAKDLRARYVDATEVVFTDGPYGGASPNLMLTDLTARKVLRPICASGVIPVVPGFIGAAPLEEGDGGRRGRDEERRARGVATLGRGGTDLTATLLGRALGAQEISLWKDVPGLLTADPRVVPDARVIPQLHVREAAELAYFGAKVLHPRALIPVAGRSIPVFVRPFADAHAAGTEISARRTLDRYPVKALSAVGGQALITVAGNGMLGVPGIAARTFEALHRQDISVSLISQSSSEQSICFSVPDSAAKQARDRLTDEFRDQIAPRRGRPGRGPQRRGDRRRRRHRHGRPPRHRRPRLRGPGRGGHQHRRDRAGLVRAEHLVRRGRQGSRGRPAGRPRRVPAVEDRRRRGGARAPQRRGAAGLRPDRPRAGQDPAEGRLSPARHATAPRRCAWWRPSTAAGSCSTPRVCRRGPSRASSPARRKGRRWRRRPAGARPRRPRRWRCWRSTR